MKNKTFRIDLKKLSIYILKRIWLVIICGAIGFAGLYGYTAYYMNDTYSAYATMYVLNGNPNVVNYQYTSSSDLSSAVQLLETYMVVVKSKKVMNVVAERLSATYPGISPNYISSTLSLGSVSDTGVLEVVCTTYDPQLSADICNAVVDVAPAEIIRVVSAGNIEVIDYADAPRYPDSRPSKKKGVVGGLAGAVAAGGLLALLFLMNRKITTTEDLTDNYTLPVLASLKREKKPSKDPQTFLLNSKSSLETQEGYAKLRMNLFYTLAEKKNRVVEVTSSISGEGKSTIASNAAISCAMSGKRVIIIDADMRRACLRDIFKYEDNLPGLSDVLIQKCSWKEAVLKSDIETLDIMPAGYFPPNPAELLSTAAMKTLLEELQDAYDLVFLDVPPINIVADPLILSTMVAGCLFVTRQNYSDHREIRKALEEAELAGMNVLGFVFYGEKISHASYYGRKYYNKYKHNYETHKPAISPVATEGKTNDQTAGEN